MAERYITNKLIRNIIIDVIIITNIWSFMNNPTYKAFFGIGISVYVIKKYL